MKRRMDHATVETPVVAVLPKANALDRVKKDASIRYRDVYGLWHKGTVKEVKDAGVLMWRVGFPSSFVEFVPLDGDRFQSLPTSSKVEKDKKTEDGDAEDDSKGGEIDKDELVLTKADIPRVSAKFNGYLKGVFSEDDEERFLLCEIPALVTVCLDDKDGKYGESTTQSFSACLNALEAVVRIMRKPFPLPPAVLSTFARLCASFGEKPELYKKYDTERPASGLSCADGIFYRMYSSGSSYGMLARVMNYFGALGGYELLVQRTAQSSPKIPLHEIVVYLEVLSCKEVVLTEHHATHFVPRFMTALRDRVQLVDDDELAVCSLKVFQQLCTAVAVLGNFALSSGKSMGAGDLSKLYYDIVLNAGSRFLASPSEAQQSQGMNLLSMVVGNVQKSAASPTAALESFSPEAFVDWLVERNVLSRLHELGRGSGVSTAFSNHALASLASILTVAPTPAMVFSLEQLEELWKAKLQVSDEDTARAVGLVFTTVMRSCTTAQQLQGLKWVTDLPDASFTISQLAILSGVAQQSKLKNSEKKSDGDAETETKEDAALTSSDCDAVITVVMDKLFEIVSYLTDNVFRTYDGILRDTCQIIANLVSDDFELSMKYLDRCFDAITAKTATHSVAPVLIANAVLNSADAVAGKRLENKDVFERVMKALEGRGQLADLLTAAFVGYKVEVGRIVSKLKLQLPVIEPISFGGSFGNIQHSVHVQSWLTLIGLFLTQQHNPAQLSALFPSLWRTCVSGAVTTPETEEFFKWLHTVVDAWSNSPLLDPMIATVIDGFLLKPISVDASGSGSGCISSDHVTTNFATLPACAWPVYHAAFRLKNVQLKKLENVSPLAAILDYDLYGLDCLWELATAVESAELRKQARSSLVRYYVLGSEAEVGKQGELCERFIDKCMSNVNSGWLASTIEQRDRIIEASLSLLNEYVSMNQTETYITPASEYTIPWTITYAWSDGDQTKTVYLPKHPTVGELRVATGKHVKFAPAKFRVLGSDRKVFYKTEEYDHLPYSKLGLGEGKATVMPLIREMEDTKNFVESRIHPTRSFCGHQQLAKDALKTKAEHVQTLMAVVSNGGPDSKLHALKLLRMSDIPTDDGTSPKKPKREDCPVVTVPASANLKSTDLVLAKARIAQLEALIAIKRTSSTK